MDNVQLWCVILAFGVLAVATIVAWRKWLPPGPPSTILYALAGAGIVLLLWYADMPPQWFDGSTGNFILGGLMALSAFLFHTRDERTFRLPFLLSFGLALMVLNLAAHL